MKLDKKFLVGVNRFLTESVGRPEGYTLQMAYEFDDEEDFKKMMDTGEGSYSLSLNKVVDGKVVDSLEIYDTYSGWDEDSKYSLNGGPSNKKIGVDVMSDDESNYISARNQGKFVDDELFYVFDVTYTGRTAEVLKQIFGDLKIKISETREYENLKQRVVQTVSNFFTMVEQDEDDIFWKNQEGLDELKRRLDKISDFIEDQSDEFEF